MSENFIILRITERGVIISLHRFSCRVKKLEFSRLLFGILKTSDIMKIHPVPVELFRVDLRTDEQTDIKKLTAASRNFANAPGNNRDDSCTDHFEKSRC